MTTSKYLLSLISLCEVLCFIEYAPRHWRPKNCPAFHFIVAEKTLSFSCHLRKPVDGAFRDDGSLNFSSSSFGLSYETSFLQFYSTRKKIEQFSLTKLRHNTRSCNRRKSNLEAFTRKETNFCIFTAIKKTSS